MTISIQATYKIVWSFSIFLRVFKTLMQLYFPKTNRKITYDVTLRRGRARIVAVEKQ